MVKRMALILLAVTLLMTGGCGDSTTDDTIAARLPDVSQASFVMTATNQFWPLTPGSRWVYEGYDEGDFEHIEVIVEAGLRTVNGVSAVVVNDVVSDDEGVIEDTDDWYAQDSAGNVWYLGEYSEELEDGEVVSISGSWEWGVDGAMAGVLMWHDPMAQGTEPYHQEFYEGEAEDVAEVVRQGDTVTVAAGTFENVLVVREWDPLEPGVTELKYYAPGVGLILEEIETGGEARIELISYQLAG